MMNKIFGEMRKRMFVCGLIISFLASTVATGCGNNVVKTEKESTVSEQNMIAQTVDQIQQESTAAEEIKSAWLEACPKTYQNSWTVESGENDYINDITYTFDAKVIVPEDLTEVAVYQKEKQPLSQDTVDRAIQFFLGDREVQSIGISSDYAISRSRVSYLLGSEDILAVLNEQPELFTDGEARLNTFLEYIEDAVKSYKKLLSAENIEQEPSYIEDDNSIRLIHELGNGYTQGVELLSKRNDGFYDYLTVREHFRFGNNLLFYSYAQRDFKVDEDELSFSRNQAIEKAKGILDELQIDHLVPAEVSYFGGYYTVSFTSAEEDCVYPTYIIDYTGGVPATPWDSDDPNGDRNLFLLGQETAYITLNEDHILRASLPVDVPVTKQIGTKNVDSIMNFAEMMEYYKAHFEDAASYALAYDASNDNYDLALKDADYNISEIRLLNLYYENEETGIYESIPTWCFLGKMEVDMVSEAYFTNKYWDNTDNMSLLGTVLADTDYEYSKCNLAPDTGAFYKRSGSNDIIRSGLATYLVDNLSIH